MNSTARLAALALLLTAACGAPRPTDTGAEPTGETSLALTSIPTGVQCVQITATGSSTVSKSFAVTGGNPSYGLALGELPLGNVAIAGQAFNAACASIAGAPPAFVADPQTVVLKPGVVTNLTMNFRPDNPVSATANFIGDVVQIATSMYATYYVMADGTVFAAGMTAMTNWATLMRVPGLANVAQIAVNGVNGCAILTTGTVQCWGGNGSGQLGNGTTTSTLATVPVNVVGISNATQLALSEVSACVLVGSSAGGSVECWGYNGDGELGNGTTTSSNVPVSVPGRFANIAAASRGTCGITYLGGIQCWGYNAYGALGNASTTNSSTPVAVSSQAEVALAAGSNHFCALRADGTLRCWGYNGQGQLGNGTYTNSSSPVLVPITHVTQIVAGYEATCVKSSSGVYCWGDNYYGEIGDGTGTNNPSPVLLSTLAPATAIAGGGETDTFFAQMADMTIDGWGGNVYNQLGNGTDTDSYVPIPISMQ
jgi:hypothetical protein